MDKELEKIEELGGGDVEEKLTKFAKDNVPKLGGTPYVDTRKKGVVNKLEKVQKEIKEVEVKDGSKDKKVVVKEEDKEV